MSQVIEKKYALRFENKILDFKIGGKEVGKIVYTNIGCLTSFLLSWKSSEIEEFLLPDINDAMNGVRNQIENGSEVINILIYHNEVVFYPRNEQPVSIPTEDFKEIVSAWNVFLNTSPLSGSKLQLSN